MAEKVVGETALKETMSLVKAALDDKQDTLDVEYDSANHRLCLNNVVIAAEE